VNIAEIMTAIAEAVGGDSGDPRRVYDFPTAKPAVPCFIVGYPDGDIDLDAAMAGGGSRVTFPCWWVMGRRDERGIRDGLSAEIASIRWAINADRTLGGAAQSARCTSASIEAVGIGGVEHVAVRFVVDVFA
jgi:hypothetical protein